MRKHRGLNHQKSVSLYGRGLTIFGSSNWSWESFNYQEEHNYFTTKASILSWAQQQFNRKWTNATGNIETKPFVPLPPDKATYLSPANLATAQPTSGGVLRWNGGVWAHLYDVYFGTAPNPPLVAQDLALGPSQTATDNKSYTLPTLQPGTTYYWKIVSKTMASVPAEGPVWSFTTAGTPPANAGTLPAPWLDADVGAVGAPGSAAFSSGTFTVAGAGADVWGTADAFHYVYQPLGGNATIVARVASVQNTSPWAKAGVMIRSSLSPGSAQAFMLVSAAKGVAFQRRLADGTTSVSTGGSVSAAPRWVKLTRSGSTITAFESANGTSWTQVGSDSFSMPSTVLIGLAVSSHVSGVTSTSFFDGVAVSSSAPPPPAPASPLPTGWNATDIGSVTGQGGTSFTDPTFSVTGQGADIWGAADAFQYAYRSLAGDGTIIARVASVENVAAWTKAGVMIRETLTAGSPHACVLVSAARGVAFQRRQAAGGLSVSTAGSLSSAPRWLKLTRIGDVFSAFESDNGSTWTLIATDTIPMSSAVFIGLAVTSHDTAASATGTFDNVVIQ
jgi:regulation of enolase protein 1 (concanavalin A-like superfamily)